ncbi:hypothetical protein PPERSA_04669 [Pseudocohnilembus persalinus]|uniref:Uncharacterized protein n=1 Tax=Pseudocohnilembus persalinus TaxID=266149 RepID=A0A0V0R4F1_PSEPJ|nr:hypothetical protein PPERSA_04669 [Pseudocohnilembus persalinus]|eukprot:KRX09363.1 hypothetical protein PPERSA_04669 [Pseudocohnilembus persalinus]
MSQIKQNQVNTLKDQKPQNFQIQQQNQEKSLNLYRNFKLLNPYQEGEWSKITINAGKNNISYQQITFSYNDSSKKQQKGWQGKILYDNQYFIEQGVSQKLVKQKLREMLKMHYLTRKKQFAIYQTQEWIFYKQFFKQNETQEFNELLKCFQKQGYEQLLNNRDQYQQYIQIIDKIIQKQKLFDLTIKEVVKDIFKIIEEHKEFNKIITTHEREESKIKENWKITIKENKEEIKVENLIQFLKENMVVNLFLVDRENVLSFQPQYGQDFQNIFTKSSEIRQNKIGNLYGSLFLDVVRKSNSHLVKTQHFISTESQFKDSADVLIVYLCGFLSQLQNLTITFITQDHFGNTLKSINSKFEWINPQTDLYKQSQNIYLARFYEDSYEHLKQNLIIVNKQSQDKNSQSNDSDDKENISDSNQNHKLKQNIGHSEQNQSDHKNSYKEDQNSQISDSDNLDSEISDNGYFEL